MSVLENYNWEYLQVPILCFFIAYITIIIDLKKLLKSNLDKGYKRQVFMYWIYYKEYKVGPQIKTNSW